ncbi:hypothetical protein FKP32DRAFT_925665 [Trametes sanguinea]|nr:hypothetical protein FKP32DRAFT_925665 [Trametes sanguinea]
MPSNTNPPPYIEAPTMQQPQPGLACTPNTAESTVLDRFVIRLTGPEPASAAVRRAWDTMYQHGGLALSPELEIAPTSSSMDIRSEGEPEPESSTSPALSTSVVTSSREIGSKYHGPPRHGGRHGLGRHNALALGSEGYIHGQYTHVQPSGGSLPRYPLGRGENLECQGYIMTIGVKQTAPVPAARANGPTRKGFEARNSNAAASSTAQAREAVDTTFALLLDTGSNTTWLLGQGYCEVDAIPDSKISASGPGSAKPVGHGEGQDQFNTNAEHGRPHASARQRLSIGSRKTKVADRPHVDGKAGDSTSTADSDAGKRQASDPRGKSVVRKESVKDEKISSPPAGFGTPVQRYYSQWLPQDPRDNEWRVRRPMHRTLITACLTKESGSKSTASVLPKVTSGNPTAFLRYADGSCVELVLPAEEYDVNLHQCYSWTSVASNVAMVDLGFRFAVAYAVSYKLDRNPVDGILGLGLSDHWTGS